MEGVFIYIMDMDDTNTFYLEQRKLKEMLNVPMMQD